MSDHLDMHPQINGQDSHEANEENEFSEEEKRQMLQIWAKLKARNESNQQINQPPILSPTYIEQQAYRNNGFKDDREIESTTYQTVNMTVHRNIYEQNQQPMEHPHQNIKQSEWEDRERMQFLNSDNVRLFLENRRLLNENIELKEQNEQYQKDLRLTRSQLSKARQELARLKSTTVSVDAFKSQMSKMASLLSDRDKSAGKPHSPNHMLNKQQPRLSSLQRRQSPRNIRSPERRSPIGNMMPLPMGSRPSQQIHHIPQTVTVAQPITHIQPHVQSYGQTQILSHHIPHLAQQVTTHQPIPLLQSQMIVPQQHIQNIHPVIQKQQITHRPSGFTDRVMSPRSPPEHQTPIARINQSDRKTPITQTTKASPPQASKSDEIMNKLEQQLTNIRNLNTHLLSQPSKETDKQRQLRNAKLIFQSENNNLKKQLADKEHKIGKLMSDLQRTRRNV